MTKIAIASCCKIDGTYKVTHQDVWDDIQREEPDLLLLLGDNVYMRQTGPRWNLKQLRDTYKNQFSEKHFKSIISRIPLMATWDDHDFGPNDSRGDTPDGRKYGRRDKTRKLFHEFMGKAKKYLNNNKPEVYCSHVIGDVKIIMLDVRYYRTYLNVKDPTMLGTKQEKWLEKELNHNKKYTIVASGVGLKQGGPKDRWSAYTEAYKRLRKLLDPVPKLLFIAGDIHRNKFFSGRNFHEVYSSGVGRKDKKSKKPLNNYGIIDFGNSRVKVSLKGTNRNDRLEAGINASNWKVM